MSARSLFSELNDASPDDRWRLVEQWVREEQEETLHLEFKTAEGQAGGAETSDKKNLAKALSAFANTEGGLLVFGIKTKKKDHVDRAKELALVPQVDRFAAHLERLRKDRTDPPVTGVQILVAKGSPNADDGVIIVWVPESIHGPHRATGTSADSGVNDKYYARSGTTNEVMSHRHLAAIFSSRPSPALRLSLSQVGPNRLLFAVRNLGGGVARSVQVRLSLHLTTDTPFSAVVESVRGDWGRKPDAIGYGEYRFAFVMTNLLYPQDRSEMALIAGYVAKGTDTDPHNLEPLKGTIRARIDAEDMQPVSIEGSIPTFETAMAEAVFPPDQD